MTRVLFRDLEKHIPVVPQAKSILIDTGALVRSTHKSVHVVVICQCCILAPHRNASTILFALPLVLSIGLKVGLGSGQLAVWVPCNGCLAHCIRLLEPVTLAGHSPNESRSLVPIFVQAEGAGLLIHDDDGAKVVLFRLLPEHPGLLSHHAVELALAPLA